MTIFEFYVNIKTDSKKERGEFLEISKKKYMEKVKDKNTIFSKIKEFFNDLLDVDIEDTENVNLQNKDLEESRKKIKALEEQFFKETVVVKNPTIRNSHVKDVKVSEATLKKMREKLNEDKNPKSKEKEIVD